jgi:hypothetical protein
VDDLLVTAPDGVAWRRRLGGTTSGAEFLRALEELTGSPGEVASEWNWWQEGRPGSSGSAQGSWRSSPRAQYRCLVLSFCFRDLAARPHVSFRSGRPARRRGVAGYPADWARPARWLMAGSYRRGTGISGLCGLANIS